MKASGKVPSNTLQEIRKAPIELLLEARDIRRRGKSWCCPFHDDRTPSASVYHNRLHCFACDRSWNAVDFVIEQDGRSLKSTVLWLCAFYGVPFAETRLSERDRPEYHRNRVVARRDAGDFVQWRNSQVARMRADRDAALGAYHRAKSYVLQRGPDTPSGELAMEVAELYEARYQEIDVRLDGLLGTPWSELLRQYRAERRAVE